MLRAAVIIGLAAGLAMQSSAQDAAPKPAAYSKVIGEVTSIDESGSKMTVKPDTGSPTDVMLDANTSFMLVPPGEKDLHKATRIELKDVVTGDRVYARSRIVDGQDHVPAVSVIVMSRSEVAQQQAKSREEWQKRGAAGKVSAVDAAARTVTISLQTPVGPKPIIVETDDKTSFRRYSPDSVKFADALPGQFGDIAAGNNLRVLGDRSADGTKIHAEQIVSGSFRNIAGTVISVDAPNNQIRVNDLLTKKPVVITVNADTNLRKLEPWMAGMIARLQGGGAAPGAAPGPTPGAAAAGATPGPRPGGGQWQGGGAGGPGGGMGRMDPNQMLERAPHFQLADLKPGDALVISSSNGADASRSTAIAVVAGVEPILAAAPSSANRQSFNGGGMWNLDAVGLPQ